MQNKEFDKLVESFLTPKTKLEGNSSFSLASLLSLVEEIDKADSMLNEVIGTSVLPSVGVTQKKYGPEPKEVTKFFQMFQDVLAQNVLNINAPIDEKLRQLIKIVNFLKQNKQLPNTTDYLSKTFSIILFVGSLNNMIGNLTPDLPTVAGTFFEKFISFMCKGEAVGEQNKIYDIKTNNEFISLKLVKNFSYTGSINGMIEFFTDKKNVIISPELKDNKQKLTVFVCLKQSLESGTIKFYSYSFGLEEFMNMLSKEKINIYNQPIELESKLLSIQMQIIELRNKKDQLEIVASSTEDSEQLEDIEQELRRLSLVVSELQKKIEDAKKVVGRTQFNIPQQIMDSLQNKLMVGDEQKDILSMSPEEKDSIIQANQELFNKNIKAIIEESNAVYYKINNFLLSSDKQRKVNAIEAYDSVKTLETNLVEYTK